MYKIKLCGIPIAIIAHYSDVSKHYTRIHIFFCKIIGYFYIATFYMLKIYNNYYLKFLHANLH